MGLFSKKPALRTPLDGVDARAFSESEWRDLRGNLVGLVSQDALVSLDPLRRVGSEVAEPLAIHTRLSRRKRRERAIDLLESVSMTVTGPCGPLAITVMAGYAETSVSKASTSCICHTVSTE